jgi:hypothetical protein
VAGGDGQDKSLYDNLSSPTAATCSIFILAAIAAEERRTVISIDIGGAYLNADIKKTGIPVRMKLTTFVTSLLLEVKPEYAVFVDEKGQITVELDKALYGCVEAASLWYQDLRGKLEDHGFVVNECDGCVFNKVGEDGVQISIGMHVDDLLVTSASVKNIKLLEDHLAKVYPETKTKTGDQIDYIGMSFDFRCAGEVRVTMKRCTDEILDDCEVEGYRPSPATDALFEVRPDSPKVDKSLSEWFHSNMAKMLYLSKRVRPECLTATAFLSTRVQATDTDDIQKLRRLLQYLRFTRDRGIVLRMNGEMSVSAYIDASYGVHGDGKSHTGASVSVGGLGPIFAKSSKQKIVSKSSTEAELVGLSDTASQAIHVRNFMGSQGYDMGPVTIYQDNMGCMALIKKGRPCSERTRHINIRNFWVAERVNTKEVRLVHLRTGKMFANVLTKPLQGQQFVNERQGLTNWD